LNVWRPSDIYIRKLDPQTESTNMAGQAAGGIPVVVAVIVFGIFFAVVTWAKFRLAAFVRTALVSAGGGSLTPLRSPRAGLNALAAGRAVALAQSEVAAEWADWDHDEARFCLSGTLPMRPGKCQGFGGGMPVTYEGGTTVRLFDWQFSVKVGKSVYVNYSQTAAVVNSLAVDLPALTLRRFDSTSNRFTDGYLEDIPSAGLTDFVAEFESLRSGEHFFRLEYVTDELAPFLRDRNWNVEWTGETLLVYSLQSYVEPELLYAFADDVVILVEMLHQAATAYEQFMDRFVEVSLGTLTENF